VQAREVGTWGYRDGVCFPIWMEVESGCSSEEKECMPLDTIRGRKENEALVARDG